MVMATQEINSADFWDFVNLPENSSISFERLNGEIVAEMPSNPLASYIAMLLVKILLNCCGWFI